MKEVKHRIYCIAKSAMDRIEVRRWLDDVGVSQETIEKLVTPAATDAANLVRLMGKRCYMAFEVGLNPNISKVRDDIAAYIDHILESKHGSVLEHVSFTFAIEGISRVLTAELNRHRAGVAISEGSMRYIRFQDMPYWLPDSIAPSNTNEHNFDDLNNLNDLEAKKLRSRALFERAFRQAQENYAALESIWADELKPESKFGKKKEITSMMRRVVPIGVSTGGVWTFNLRALRHVCTMRGDGAAAEEEINSLAIDLLMHMMTTEINFFGDFSEEKPGVWKPKHVKV